MTAVSFPVTRPTGRALVIGQPPLRAAPREVLLRLGMAFTEVDEPYDAMVQLCRRPLFYSSVILSLNSLYREELQMIPAIKRRFSHMEIWLSDTDGRQAALAEAMRLGADGLVSEDGLHRIATPAGTSATGVNAAPPATLARSLDVQPTPSVIHPPVAAIPSGDLGGDPLLTAEELKALLQDVPASKGEQV